jgi:hypothetical protein
MSIKKTMNYIENNKDKYLNEKNKKYDFICDHCLEPKNMESKAPYSSDENEDMIYCYPCIDEFHETGEW